MTQQSGRILYTARRSRTNGIGLATKHITALCEPVAGADDEK